jgi:hypothetical protein
MATYYVRPASDGGSDAAAGTAVGTAWATIDKAANTVAAGDTVWIKPAVYRELVTMDTSGSSGSSITYNGDFDGAKFGTVGPVIISAWDDDTGAPVRASCWGMNGKTFVVVNKIQFMGGTSFCVGNTAFASATAYEGCEFNDCVIQGSGNDVALTIELNAGVTPTANGLTIRRCAIVGHMKIDWDSQATANNNLKWTIERCLITGISNTAAGITFTREANGGANTIAGVTIKNCLFWACANAIQAANLADTTNPFVVANCTFSYGTTAITGTATAGTFITRNNIFSGYGTAISNATEYADSYLKDVPMMIGGIHDWLYYQTYGWSPFKPWEPMAISGIYTDPSIGYGTLEVTASNDIYANPAMGRPSAYSHIYYFDGSDAAVSDPNAVWFNETNITDTSITTYSDTSATGSTGGNYVMAEGTNAPGSGETIANVYCRQLNQWGASNAANRGDLVVYTDALGEALATIAQSTTTTTATWGSWTLLTTPSGGWTWAKVQALEFKAYRLAGGAGTFGIGQIQVYVATAEIAPDAGLVEARTRPAQESGTVHGDTYAANFQGAGYYDSMRAVSAASTTITVYCRKDGNYSGTNPKLEVVNIPGVADQSDSLSVAAGNWEQLSVNFTPTSAGWVRIRLWSYDTSATGKCFFDDLVVS